MMLTIGLRPTWLQIVFILCITQLFTECLAQESVSSRDSSVTAQARSPDPSTKPSQSSSTSSAPAQTHTIEVGLADHKFRPESTEAAIGDTIEFLFYPANHSVVRAEYGYPCIPYEMTGSSKVGFFSGFNPVNKVVDNPPKYSIRINNTDPIFFYCSAPGSCIRYGMVGAINLNTSTSIDKQRKLATDSAYMLNPGEPFPPESPLPSNNPATSSSTPNPGSTDKKGLSAGAIAGVVVGAVGGLILGALLFFFWGRTKTLKDEVERKESSITRRISPSTSTANMVQTPRSPPPPTPGQAGLGMYQHFGPTHVANATVSPTSPDQTMYSSGTPAPSYFSSQAQAQHPQAQTMLDHGIERKYLSTSPPPHGHPAFSTPLMHQHESYAQDDAILPASYANSYFPVAHSIPHQHHHHHRTHSPHCLSTSSPGPAPLAHQPVLGPYGQQQQDPNAPAPPYGWHVNGQVGPVEMEGETEAARGRVEARWEEVQPESKDGGRGL
ncbi:hypothetical protein FB567DRAFT_201402 [Paraphoma chrysanthemicola]|uniref:Extracellular serine-rich protein n=1 Tax=Paraphoma chrysanthemicola TaxID=798071 RepID=A0A8K0QUP4_9PLEO|nr:hypothetical protein FB567DRAFT_201402 [Paraphoma chrysanthemicola]